MTAVRGMPVGEFGVLLKQHRLAARLTQERFAERAKLSVRTVSDLERGRVHAPRAPSVLLLADALGLTGPSRDRFERCGRDAYWHRRFATELDRTNRPAG